MSGMEPRHHDLLSRRIELLADRALEGLDEPEQLELRTMSQTTAGPDDEALDLVAARLARAVAEPGEPMPAEVAERVRATLAARVAAAGTASVTGPASATGTASAARRGGSSAAMRTGRGWTIVRAAGGFAAAAALVLLALVAVRERFAPVLPANPAEARAALVSRATDLVTLRWQGTDHPAIRRARDMGLIGGDVVWSDLQAAGFVRVCHLGINDPAAGSYRVWIWNADEPDGPPIASCRFDVTQVADFTVVPIESEIAGIIERPVRASVTLEPAGTSVQRPSPEDELLVARLRPGARELESGLPSEIGAPGRG